MIGQAAAITEARGDELLLAARCAASPPCRDAWSTLYDRYAGGVKAWIRQGYRLCDDEAVDDLTQKVFIHCAGGALARYRGEIALKSYLYLIADRVRISENRRLSRKRRDVRRQLSMDAFVGGDGQPNLAETLTEGDSMPHRLGMWFSDFGARPDRVHERKTFGRMARGLVAKLPDEVDREIVRLYFWEGAVDRTIGERLGIPTNTVTWQRHRAIARLRGIWKRNDSRSGLSLVPGKQSEMIT